MPFEVSLPERERMIQDVRDHLAIPGAVVQVIIFEIPELPLNQLETPVYRMTALFNDTDLMINWIEAWPVNCFAECYNMVLNHPRFECKDPNAPELHGAESLN